jgi:hypothetical protein
VGTAAGDAEDAGVLDQFGVVEIVIAEDKHRRVPGQCVQHIGPADITAVNQIFGLIVEQNANGVGCHISPAMGVAEDADDHRCNDNWINSNDQLQGFEIGDFRFQIRDFRFQISDLKSEIMPLPGSCPITSALPPVQSTSSTPFFLPMLQWPGKKLGPRFLPQGCAAMNLSTERYQEITESINVVGQDEPRAADRRAPRVKLSNQLSVTMWADPSTDLSVRVRDMSHGGIGLFYSQRIGLDEQIVIRFPQKNGDDILVLGTVVYWEPLAESLYGIGVQFDREVNESEIARQSDQTVRQQSNQIGVMARMTQAFARTWRIAS